MPKNDEAAEFERRIEALANDAERAGWALVVAWGSPEGKPAGFVIRGDSDLLPFNVTAANKEQSP